MTQDFKRLLVAASGTGGHLFPAIAVAEQLPDYQIEWLGVPGRLEEQLVPSHYPLHQVDVEGFQTRGIATLRVLYKLLKSVWQVRQILAAGQFDGVFTTGGYIAAPAVMAARSLGIPVILHESNALPGKVTRWLSRWCDGVAIGFEAAKQYLPQAKQVVWVGTPVRSQFLQDPPPPLTDLPIPAGVPLLVMVGGSQGAVALNQMIRDCAPAWLAAGLWIVHQTGQNDAKAATLEHPHYFPLPFYHNMAGLFHRANLVISRSGAGTLTELAIARTPAILVPYPFAAEDHQAINAQEFAKVGAAQCFRQADLTIDGLTQTVLRLFCPPDDSTADAVDLSQNSPYIVSQVLQAMADRAASLAVPDSAQRLAKLIRQRLEA
jgi:UDP-N-acetylglucosamine--N-acetylmuramyl-(pentapeptide) pyrophosphoryl-undecaprenol N-acetylglucosamine transferase